MVAVLEMPRVQECSATGCAYNHNGCHAFAITIGGPGHAHCDTFLELGVTGGIEQATAQVGACLQSDCRHNVDLECRASAIHVGATQAGADCLTYAPA